MLADPQMERLFLGGVQAVEVPSNQGAN